MAVVLPLVEVPAGRWAPDRTKVPPVLVPRLSRLLLRWRQRLREEQEAFSAQPFNGAVTLAATAPAALLSAATVGLDRDRSP